MDDCPNCGCEHCYEQYDDEWDGVHESSGEIYDVKMGEIICPDCGWSESFEADRHYHQADFGYAALMTRGYD